MNFNNFTKPLLNWYREHKRDLPFRASQNPYHIWVSEIMAQQTQIATMIPYYHNWINTWPTINDLSQADEQSVLKAWEGLGYYTRAKNLHKASKLIFKEFNGVFPQNVEQIEKLPGIGDYTANAIASIAFNQKAIAVDGNVIRVMSRVTQDERDFLVKKNKEQLKTTLYNLLEDEIPSDYTQALMELGALICTPKNPKCEVCPLNRVCLAYKNNTQLDYPTKKIKKKNPILEFDTFVIIKNNQILISFDDSDGLMKGLIRLPQNIKTIENIKPLLQSKHIFSHKTWIMNVYDIGFNDEKNPLYKWINLDELELYPMISAHKTILASLGHLK